MTPVILGDGDYVLEGRLSIEGENGPGDAATKLEREVDALGDAAHFHSYSGSRFRVRRVFVKLVGEALVAGKGEHAILAVRDPSMT